MLGGYGMKGSGKLPALARQRLTAFPGSSRSMSSFRPQFSKQPIRYGRLNQTLAGSISWRSTAAVPGLASARFNSTSSTASDTFAPASGNPPTELSDINADISAIPEKIGYLKEMGLDYGWGPSAFIEYVMEHVHMYTGLPWWASIMATGVLVRAALFYPTLGAADTGAKIQNVKHITKPIQSDLMRFGQEGKQAEMMQARAQVNQIHHDNGIKAWKSFVPMIQIPFGYGCYRVVNGMAKLPIPGLAEENLLWLTDLTIPDPTYILPAVQAVFMYFTFRKGGESGLNELSSSTFGKAFLIGLPGLTFAFTCFFPAALQLYFAATGLFALGQAYLIHNHTFRRWAGIAIAKPVAASGGLQSDQSKALRMLQDRIKEEKAQINAQKAGQRHDISFIDRALDSLKETKGSFSSEWQNKVNEYTGKGPRKNADGSLAPGPRLSDKDAKLASDYERRRREEEAWRRDERNHARREAHLKTLQAEKEKAARS